MALIAISLTLAGCGGGGGGGSGGGETESAHAFTPTTAVDKVTVNGNVSYDSIPNITGSLQYSAVVSKPVRGASVQMISSETQSVVASGVTDADGKYAIDIPRGTMVFARVLATLQHDGSGPSWNVSVRDNTQDDGLYALDSAAFTVTDATPVRKDVHATSGWSGQAYTTARAAGPFAILDVVYMAQAKVLSVAPNAVFAPLQIFWSINNTPTAGDITLGQIGSSNFSPMGGVNAIYLLGKADVDTDEYDTSVVAHEWGHYFQSAFSRNDSPGGAHNFGDLVDLRLAFSEGWATGMSGIVLDSSSYNDSLDIGQQGGFSVSLKVGATGTKGWFRETSIQHVIWQLHDLVGFKPLFDAMTGSLKTATPMTSIYSFNAALKLAASAAASSFAPMLTAENIDSNADAWGSTETNDGGSAVALPLYRALPLGRTPTVACVSNTFGADKGGNKLGNYTFLRFVISAARTYEIRVTSTDSTTDPDFQLYNAKGIFAYGDASTSSTETLQVALAPNEYVLTVADIENRSARTCFNVTVN